MFAIGLILLVVDARSARADLDLADFLLPAHRGTAPAGVEPAACATGCTTGECGACGPYAGAGQCYGGHLPCCADVRGCRDRWRLWGKKKCRCLHHQTFYPPAAPLFHPTWGYHQTCWRRFPPLPPCPPADLWLMPGACETVIPGELPLGTILPQPLAPETPPTPPAPSPGAESVPPRDYTEPVPPSESAPGIPEPAPDSGDSDPTGYDFEMPRTFERR
jgi:hypothetical protein